MRMNMSDFATFFAVARNQSFRAAGDELGLSSSAISHSITECAQMPTKCQLHRRETPICRHCSPLIRLAMEKNSALKRSLAR